MTHVVCLETKTRAHWPDNLCHVLRLCLLRPLIVLAAERIECLSPES